jgi:hypothetical protein
MKISKGKPANEDNSGTVGVGVALVLEVLFGGNEGVGIEGTEMLAQLGN